MSSAYLVPLLLLVASLIACALFFVHLSKSVSKQVSDALEEATTEEQEIIRKKVVSAMFPPRFRKD